MTNGDTHIPFCHYHCHHDHDNESQCKRWVLDTPHVLSRPNILIYHLLVFFFCLFIQNNKLQTQIQLQTWRDKKHRTGWNPLGCQKRVPYPVGIWY